MPNTGKDGVEEEEEGKKTSKSGYSKSGLPGIGAQVKDCPAVAP